MAKGFQVSEWIDRPHDRVWALMSQPERAPEWMPGLERVSAKDDAPMAPGKVYSVEMTTTGRGKVRDMTLAAWDPPAAFALSSQEGSVTATYTYRCEPQKDGTRVALDARCEATGFVTRLLHPLIVRMMARHDRGQLRALKALAEGESG